MKKPKNKEKNLNEKVEFVNPDTFNLNDLKPVNTDYSVENNGESFNTSSINQNSYSIDADAISQNSAQGTSFVEPEEKKPNLFQRIGNRIFRNSSKKDEKTEEVVAEPVETQNEVTPTEDPDHVKQEMLAQESAKTEANSQVDAPLTEQQFQELVAGDIQRLKQELKGLSTDYIESLRKTDYYKERLEYWKNYYKNLRTEADKQNADKNAQLDALNELEQKDEVKVETDKSSQLEVAEVALKNSQEKSQEAQQIDVSEPINFKVNSEKNTNTEYAITIDKNVDVANYSTNLSKKSREELKEEVDYYTNLIVIALLGKSLSETRDRARAQQLNFKTKKSVGSSYVCKQFKNRTDLLNECAASFAEVYKDGKTESKRAISSHQKSIELHNEKPDLMSSGDMIAESLRTEYGPAISEYLSERIVSSIMAQNRQDDIKITKASVTKMIKNIIVASTPDLAEAMDQAYNGSVERFDKAVENLATEKSNLENKFADVEQRKLVEKDINNNLRHLKYSKVVIEDKKKNEIKKLDLKSPQVLFDEIIEAEVEKTLSKYNDNTLSDYGFDGEKAKKKADVIIGLMEKSRDDKSLPLPARNEVESEVEYNYTVQGVELPKEEPKKTIRIDREYFERQIEDLRIEKRRLEKQNKSENLTDEQKNNNEAKIAEIKKQDEIVVAQYSKFLEKHPKEDDFVEELVEER
ncbi:MAG TPA: hypothetical protein DCZ34_00845 [Clostridiales bacterium]|nr:hypothetical protein [Clostridiales bacterium]